MLSKTDQKVLRERLFRHLDGLVTVPVSWALHEKGVPAVLSKNEPIALSELTAQTGANEGYLNIALRMLASQGWLKHHTAPTGEVTVQATPALAEALQHLANFEPWVKLLRTYGMFRLDRYDTTAFDKLIALFEDHRKRSAEAPASHVVQQVLSLAEGALIAPVIVQLGMGGMFHKYFMEASFRAEEYHADGPRFRHILDFLAWMGWFREKRSTYTFTDTGLFYAQRASSYGVTVSYLPMMAKVHELIFGNAHVLDSAPGEPERHVDREMNVWGSGGAHAAYFSKVDEVIMEIFNRPIDAQPKGVLDMGCGNGAFLIHIFDVVEQRTLRGKMLDEYPLILAGVDYNEASLKITRANLIKADVWAKVVWGDIGEPERLAEDLLLDYNIQLSDLLNVRTFLDHNRPWRPPFGESPSTSASTGAYACKGTRLLNADVEQSLVEHFSLWKPYVQKHGLLIIELHTIDPALCAANLGRTPATAYDATHGFSDQYILEHQVYLDCASRAGLQSDPRYAAAYPPGDLATVSINLFRA